MNSVQEKLLQWKQLLDEQTADSLKLRENGEGWTLGQLYMHLIQSTIFFSKQITSCLASDQHQEEPLLPKAASIFKAGSLPDLRITGPASNSETPEPEGLEFLQNSLERLMEKFGTLESAIALSGKKGKARHPGDLGYFTAAEWLQFTAIHLNHHFRQYERIISGTQS